MKAKVSSAALLVQVSSTVGVQETPVGARCLNRYTEQKLEKTLHQLQKRPGETLFDTPLEFVVHQTTSETPPGDSSGYPLIVMEPDGPEDRQYTIHATLKEAQQLVDLVTFDGAPVMPKNFNKKEPTHLVATP